MYNEERIKWIKENKNKIRISKDKKSVEVETIYPGGSKSVESFDVTEDDLISELHLMNQTYGKNVYLNSKLKKYIEEGNDDMCFIWYYLGNKLIANIKTFEEIEAEYRKIEADILEALRILGCEHPPLEFKEIPIDYPKKRL